jgi:hypothetical protein
MENLDLIDWKMVGFASLWITGLAVILSVLGFVDYHAKERKIRFRQELRRPGYQAWINVGLTLFCIGLLGSSDTWWERILWGLLALAFIWFSVQSFQESRKNNGGRAREGSRKQESGNSEQETGHQSTSQSVHK